MAKIKIEIKKQETKTFEVDLPHFRKWGTTFYKIISNEIILKVETFHFMQGICLTKYAIDTAFDERSEEINESEFNSNYETINQFLKTQL